MRDHNGHLRAILIGSGFPSWDAFDKHFAAKNRSTGRYVQPDPEELDARATTFRQALENTTRQPGEEG